MAAFNNGFVGVVVRTEPEITVSYRSNKFVAEEGLRDGKWVTLSYNAAGYLMAANDLGPPYMDTERFAAPQSFALNIGGQDLCSDWAWGGAEVTEDERCVRACVTLVSAVRPVTVKIHTVLDGTDVMERFIEAENTGEGCAPLYSVSPMAGGLQQTGWYWHHVLPGEGMYRLGYMKDSAWGEEGNFKWVDLPDAGYSVYGRYRRDRFRHPMFVLENRLTGEIFTVQLAWSGGYAFDFDLSFETLNEAALSMNIRIDAPGPLLVLQPGEKYTSPSVHFGMVFGGLDPAIQAMHSHVRRSVFRPYTRGISGWVLGAIGPEYPMDLENTLAMVEYAHGIGCEAFWIDAGWFVGPCDKLEWNGWSGNLPEWWLRSGDWRYSEERYPNGIAQVRDFVHEKGMLFGLWMDADRIGPKSAVWNDHNGWLAKNYNGRQNDGGLLNLADPEAAAWMEEQITYLIEEYKIEYFKLDHNVEAVRAVCRNERDGYLENTYARYYQNVYGVYKRLRDKYPDVIFENCASGGGRSDLGMAAHFTHTFVSDWVRHPNALRVINGMTMALPPERVQRCFGGIQSYITADLDFQLRNLMFTVPVLGGIKPPCAEDNPVHMEALRKYVKLYKEFVRPMHANSRIFHHTPELHGGGRSELCGGGRPHAHASGFCVLEMDAGDASRGMLGVFRLAEPEQCEVKVRLKGINAGKDYEVTFDNSGDTAILSGYELSRNGIPVALGGPLTSELILYRLA